MAGRSTGSVVLFHVICDCLVDCIVKVVRFKMVRVFIWDGFLRWLVFLNLGLCNVVVFFSFFL